MNTRRTGDSETRIMRLSGAAAFLGICRSSAYQLIQKGHLRPLTFPGLRGLRFDRADLETFVAEAKRAGEGARVK
jgi:excisionase family DNA binding protein